MSSYIGAPTDAVRLRKVFKYPEEDDEPEAMDEEEQEQLIKRLKKEMTTGMINGFIRPFKQFFVGATMTPCTFFLPTLLNACYTSGRWLAVAAIASLIATVYTLVLVPTKGRDIKGSGRKGQDPVFTAEIELSPAQRFVPILNFFWSLSVGYRGLQFRHHGGVHNGFWILCLIPAIMYFTIMAVRRFIIEVDPEMLDEMRYEFKGA